MFLLCLAVARLAIAQPTDVRTITMRVAVDERYRMLPDWETTLRNTVQRVSDIYERYFQVRFVILDIVDFAIGPDASIQSRLEKLVTEVPIGEADVLVGSTGGRCEKVARGVARPFDRFAVIMAVCEGGKPLDGHGPASVLSHELAHLFGAFHPAISVESVMRGGPADLFDDQTARVVRLMRGYDFRRGVLAIDEATRRAWRAIYAEGHQRNDEANPLAFAITNAGLKLARSGRPAEGEAAIREAIKIDQLLPEPHVALGTLYAQRDLLEEAVREFRLAKGLNFRDAGVRAELGLVLLRLGRDQEALPELDIALRIDPELPRARLGLCVALSRSDKLDEAVRGCTEVIRRAPQEPIAFNARGRAYAQKGELDWAILDYDESIRLSPTFATAFNGRGLVHRRKGDVDRAIQDFDQAIRLQPTVAVGWNNRCFARAIGGQLAAALADCDQALRLQPKSAEALDSRGLTYLKLGGLDRAIADYDAALHLDRKYAHALYGRGLAKRKTGDHSGAEADIAAARAISPRVAADYAGYALDP